MSIFSINSEKKRGYWAFAFSLVLLVALSALDILVSTHCSLTVLYLIPITLVIWFTGPKAGIFFGLCSIIVWFFASLPCVPHLYHKPIFFYLNMIFKICFLFFLVYILTQLKNALKTIRIQNEELKKFDDRKSAFVGNLAHELRGPLGVVRESQSMLIDETMGKVPSEQKEILEAGRRSINRLLRLVKNLLDLSQIEAGKLQFQKEEIDIRNLVETIVQVYEPEFRRKKLPLKREIQGNVGALWGDPDKIEQIINNLLGNALKYTPKGSVTIRLSGNDKEIRLEIEDTGPGVPECCRIRLFDKFQRIMINKKEGVGLGLSIVKDMVELHQGKIWIEGEEGKGSAFIVTLPRNFQAS